MDPAIDAADGRPTLGRPPRSPALAIVAGGALLAAFAPGHPTAQTTADTVWKGAFAIVVGAAATASARSRDRRPGPPLRQGIAAAFGASAANIALRLPRRPLPTYVPTLIAAALLAVVGTVALTRMTRRERGVIGSAVVLLGAGAAACVALAAWRLLGARGELTTAASAARAGLDTALRGDIDGGRRAIDGARTSLERAARRFDSPAVRWARALPVVGQHLAAGDDLVRDGMRVATASAELVALGDVSALRDADGRIDLARLSALRVDAATAQRAVRALRDDADAVDASPWIAAPLQRRVRAGVPDIDRAEDTLGRSVDALTVLPDVLGGSGTRTYFLAIVNPAEARGGGGFLGSYGVLTAERGRLSLVRFGRTAELNDALVGTPERDVADAGYRATFGLYRPDLYWQNVNLGPDFPRTAALMADQYERGTGTHVDGVISIDPFALEALLRITGPITVPGWDGAFDGTNTARILQHEIYVRSSANGDENLARIAVQGTLAQEVWQRLATGALPNPATAASELAPVVRRRSLQVWLRDDAEQRWTHNIGADGAFPRGAAARADAPPAVAAAAADAPPSAGTDSTDRIAVVVNNASGYKIDWFLREQITYDVRIDDGGAAEAELTVTLRNEAPASGLSAYILGPDDGDVPPGTSVSYVTVYSPLALDTSTADGEPITFDPTDDLGLHAYSTTVLLDAGEQVVLRLRLRGVLPGSDRRYRLELLGQVLCVPAEARVVVRGPGTRALDAQRTLDGDVVLDTASAADPAPIASTVPASTAGSTP